MIKVKLLRDNVKIPKKAFLNDAGFDVFSLDSVIIKPMHRYKFGLGIAVEIAENSFLMVSEKSGMAIDNGLITIANIIDAGYRGEIHVVLLNLSNKSVDIKVGQKIGQLILMNHLSNSCEIEIVNELSSTDRGIKGFGSTGKF